MGGSPVGRVGNAEHTGIRTRSLRKGGRTSCWCGSDSSSIAALVPWLELEELLEELLEAVVAASDGSFLLFAPSSVVSKAPTAAPTKGLAVFSNSTSK